MQRVKHASRRMETRNRIILGALVIKAGAGELPPDELVALLSDYMKRRTQIPAGHTDDTPQRPAD